MSQVLSRRQKLHVLRARVHRGSCYESPGSSLGLSLRRVDDLIHEVRRGLSFRTLESLSSESGISVSELSSILDIPDRTLARRKAAGRLARDESERLLGMSGLFEKAVELF